MSDESARAPRAGGRVVDIVCVVRDAQRVGRCVASVLASSNETAYELTVVVPGTLDDRALRIGGASIGSRVRIVRTGRLVDVATTIDRALCAHPDRDVVLLRQTAEVAGDWLDRLVVHAGSRGDAVVGTFTNEAGAATYPRLATANRLPEGTSVATLDASFARANRGRAADLAAVFGPCVYVTRGALAALGDLGHGLATDVADRFVAEITARAADSGTPVLVAGDVFVGCPDAGAGPAVDPIRGADDALRPLARRVDLARLASSSRPIIVFVSHAWHGGVRRHMDDLARFLAGRAEVLYLLPAGGDAVALHWPREGEAFSAWFRLPEELATLAATLAAIGCARLHFHHVHGLPRSILDLPRACDVPYDCTLHDYFAICPQYHLVAEDGRYCGEPDAAGCTACLARRPAQWGLDIGRWRATFERFLSGAARVIAPSLDVATRMRRHFPALAIDVWPHAETPLARLPPVVRVVTLGNLSPEKGLHVVAACAADAKARALPLAFRVLGATGEPIAQFPDVPLTIHGSYAEEDVARLLAEERADVLFFPAQVPETYAYTLSVALATETPIVASAMGAFVERLAGRANARTLPYDATPAQWNAALVEAALAARRNAAPAAPAGVPARIEP
ncbi:MAG: glycosyltransferase [Rudaea sp.]